MVVWVSARPTSPKAAARVHVCEGAACPLGEVVERAVITGATLPIVAVLVHKASGARCRA